MGEFGAQHICEQTIGKDAGQGRRKTRPVAAAKLHQLIGASQSPAAKGTAAHWSELCKQELWERGKPRRTVLSHPFVSRESDDSVKKASHCWSCGIQNL